jgi:F-type H+-transporting ATPase subunit gamma
MAGGQERILRRRIRSVQATKKITRAMELIAASRIVKAQARVHAAVPYADGITEVVRDLQAAGAGGTNPYLTPRDEIRNSAIVVLSADRGLCGAYNSSVLRAAEAEMRDQAKLGRSNRLVTVGRKAEGYFRFRGYDLDASFSGFSDNPSYEDARGVARAVIERFADGELDLVQIAYTRFVTVGRQEVIVRPLLPLGRETFASAAVRAGEAVDGHPPADYEYEPNPDAILDALLPRYAEARLFAAMLNAAASEHAARQRAMKAATDNAEDLIRGLTRIMNRARQDAITTEIMEIVGGAEALRSGASEPRVVYTAEYAEPFDRIA